MNLSMNNDLEKRYLSLKKKLECLDFHSPLGLESVDLADKLLSKLVKTTEGFKAMQMQRDKLLSELESEKQVPLPLRNENAKLMKENNELHREIIKVKEEMEAKEISLTQAIRKLEAEKEEVKFLLGQKDIHIRNIENESESLRRKMNEVVNKVYGTNDREHSSTYSVNYKYGLPNAEKILKNKNSSTTMNTMNIIGKKMELEMTKGLDTNPNYENLQNATQKKQLLLEMTNAANINKEEWANDLKLADERAEKYRNEIRKLEEEKQNLSNKIEFYEKQIGHRDLEIKRVQNSFLNTDNIEELKVRYQSDNMKMTIEKLNSQIDFLNNENNKLKANSDFHNHRCREEEVKKLDAEIIKLKKDKENLNRKLEMFEKNSMSGENRTKNTNLSNSNSNFPNFDNQNSIELLKEENRNLSKEIEKNISSVKKLTEDLNLNNSNFNSERLALIKSIDKLKDENIANKNLINNLNLNLEEISKKNEQLQTEIGILKGRELLISKDSENKADNVSKIHKEYTELINESKNLRKKISDLEEKNLNLTKENRELTLEKDNLSATKTKFEKISSLKEDETNTIKNQFDNVNRNLERNENQIKVLETKRKLLEEENKNLNEIIENKNSVLKEVEMRCDNYYRQLQDANDNYTTLQIEHKNLSQEITEILSSNKKLEERIRSYEREFNENKYVKDKLSDYEEKEKSLKNDLRLAERENKVMKNEVKHLNETLNELRNENNTLNSTLRILQEDKKKLIDQLELNSNDLLVLEENSKQINDITTTLNENKQKIIELNNKVLAKQTEIEKLKSDKSLLEFEIKKKGIEIAKLTESVQKLNFDVNSLKIENKSLLEENDKYKEEILIKKLNENNNIDITTNLLETKEILEKEKSTKEKLIFENKSLNEKMQKLNFEKTNLENKIASMTNLINEADLTRGEMFDKLQEELNKNKAIENEIMILRERERNLDGEINRLLSENNDLKQGLGSFNVNFDNLNNELDVKTEEISKLNLLLQNLKDQNEDLTKKLSVQLNKANVDTRRILDRETELKEIKNYVSLLENENIDIKNTLNSRNKEIQDLNFDLRSLQNENQSLLEELQSIARENEKLALIKSQLEKNTDMISQKYRSNELDLNDVYTQYKEVCIEKERLQQNLKIFIDENKMAANYIKQIENTLANYKNNASNSVMEKENLLKKIDFLEKYNSELTNEISKLKDEINLRGDEQNILRRNVELDKEINLNYEGHIAGLNRQIAKLEKEKQNLIDNLNTLNNRVEYLNHSKNEYEANLRNFEDIITEERKKLHSTNNANQKLREEVNALREENKKIVKMINENKDIKELRAKILGDMVNSNNANNINVNVNVNNTNSMLKSDNFVSETVSSGEENNILKRLIHDLNSQIEDLKKDLRTVREENTRLVSERSMNNILSDRNMSNNSMDPHYD